MKYFKRALKSKLKAMLSTLFDLAYFSSYLQTKETAWKRGDACFLEVEMLWSLLGLFWKDLIKIKILQKSLMVVSLTPRS